jgi:cytochrome c oxidase subunit 2
VSVVLFVLVVGVMVYFAIKYRRRSQADRPSPVHESKLMEAAWIVVPTILVLVVFTWGFKAFLKVEVAPPNAYEIRVYAQKWSWRYEYPNGATSSDLHVPVGRPIKLKMSSADVLHSYFVPAFRVKQDVLPNRYTSVWFEATRQDTFQVYCTEYCGTSHSGMLSNVIVQSQDEFNDFLTEGVIDPNAPPAERGAILYEQQACQSCHTLDGTAVVGPSFQGLYGKQEQLTDGSSVTVDDNYLRESILEPNAKIVQGFNPIMPANYTNLSEEEINALIAFIQEQQ